MAVSLYRSALSDFGKKYSVFISKPATDADLCVNRTPLYAAAKGLLIPLLTSVSAGKGKNGFADARNAYGLLLVDDWTQGRMF